MGTYPFGPWNGYGKRVFRAVWLVGSKKTNTNVGEGEQPIEQLAILKQPKIS
jgi:hypothetical protein